MRLFYEGFSNKSVVYMIYNTQTHGIYIGQAKECKERWKYGYIDSLRRGTCHNKHLQNSYNKYFKELGHDDFLEFHILRVMEGSTQTEREILETQFIEFYYDFGFTVYNIIHQTVSSKKICYSLTPEKTRKKLSESMKLRWKEEKFSKKMSNSFKIYWNSEEGKKNIFKIVKNRVANQPPKNYKPLISPDGIIYENITYVPTFAKEHNLDKQTLYYVLNGTKKSMMGWKLAENKDYVIATHKKYNVKLVDPTGKIFELKGKINLAEFACNHGLYHGSLGRLISGKINEHKGWTIFGNMKKTLKNKRKISFISADGIIYSDIGNVTEFCEINDLKRYKIDQLISRKIDEYNGWKLISIEGNSRKLTSKRKNFHDIEYHLISYNDIEYQGKNINTLAKELKIRATDLYKVITGEALERQGIRKYGNDISYKLISPVGEIVSITNISKFSKINNLNANQIYKLVNNQIKSGQHKGWTLPKTGSN